MSQRVREIPPQAELLSPVQPSELESPTKRPKLAIISLAVHSLTSLLYHSVRLREYRQVNIITVPETRNTVKQIDSNTDHDYGYRYLKLMVMLLQRILIMGAVYEGSTYGEHLLGKVSIASIVANIDQYKSCFPGGAA